MWENEEGICEVKEDRRGSVERKCEGEKEVERIEMGMERRERLVVYLELFMLRITTPKRELGIAA